MKKLYLLPVIVLACFQARAQHPTPVPTNYFEQQVFLLSPDTGLHAGFVSLAIRVQQFLDQTYSRYTVSDSTTAATLAQAQANAAFILGADQQAISALEQSWQLNPAPAYRIPPGWATAAFLFARIQSKTSVVSFSKLLETAVVHQIDRLPQTYREDLVNAQKGNYAPSSTAFQLAALNELLHHIRKRCLNSATVDQTMELLDNYVRYMIRLQGREAIEAALYLRSSVRISETKIRIPLRDGIYLSAWLYRNNNEKTKVPAIIALSPYPTANEAMRGNLLAASGYAYLYIDARGRGESEGRFTPFETEGRDFYDVIDWASKQPWCNGKVAGTGGSYLGYAQWQAIRQPWRHPALRAINPMAAVAPGIDFPLLSGQFFSYALQWANYVNGNSFDDALFTDNAFWSRRFYAHYQQGLAFAQLDAATGFPNRFFREWMKHPQFDEYWRSRLPAPNDYAKLDIPILSTTGYFDADQPGALYYYQQQQRYGSAIGKDNHFLIIGPYDHSGAQWQPGLRQNGASIEPNALVPLYRHIIDWFNWVLKDKGRPAFFKDRVTYFASETGKWQGAPRLSAISTDTLRFYLSSARVPGRKGLPLYRLLTKAPQSHQTIPYSQNLAVVWDSLSLFSSGNAGDDSLYINSPGNIVFESAPLLQPILLSGKLISSLYLSLNKPDADFLVTVYEVSASGRSTQLATTSIRSRYRNGPSPELLMPGTIARHRFADSFLYIKKIQKGSRIRLSFEIPNSPWFERNFGLGTIVSQETAQETSPFQVLLHAGIQYPSSLQLPFTRLP